MKTVTLLTTLGAALLSANLAIGDELNHKTVVTFSEPVAIPAVHQPGWGVLPPGTYVFRLLDSPSNRHIVQIFNKEENRIYATILAIPNMRLKPTDKVVITFRETPADQPLALLAMFYPGAIYGEEFVYPKEKAVEIARAVSQPVLSMPIAKEEIRPEASEIVAELTETPVAAVAPSGEEVAMAEVVTPLPAQIAPKMALPQTASPIPLLALIGFLTLGAGTALRLAEKRIR